MPTSASANSLLRACFDVRPIVIQDELTAGNGIAVARAGVIRRVSFKEYDAVAFAAERPAQSAPQGGVAVPPR